jgi:hypothetical protein
MKVTPTDIGIASMPPIASITLGHINSLVGIVGGLLGIAYLLWRWKRDVRRDVDKWE